MTPQVDRATSSQPTIWRLAVRVFLDARLHSEKRIEQTMSELEASLPKLAEEHATLSAAGPVMVEIEFLDETDVNQRFFRIGTDPRQMVQPLEVRHA